MRFVLSVVPLLALLGCVVRPAYRSPVVPAVAMPMAGPAMPMGAMGMGPMVAGGYMLPPPPPPDVAFVNGHGYPNEWRGAHQVRVHNRTHFYVRVRMDGTEVAVADQMVGLGLVPPRQEAHLYAPLDRTNLENGCERHHFEFEAYLAPNFDRPAARGSTDEYFCASRGRQLVEIGPLCFTGGYC